MSKKTTWEKLPAVASDKIHHGCICCSNVLQIAHEGMLIAVGFGDANVTCDGKLLWSEMQAQWDAEEKGEDGTELWELEDAEKAALADPDHDWRINKYGPLHGESYQRQGDGKWVLIESNMGFA